MTIKKNLGNERSGLKAVERKQMRKGESLMHRNLAPRSVHMLRKETIKPETRAFTAWPLAETRKAIPTEADMGHSWEQRSRRVSVNSL